MDLRENHSREDDETEVGDDIEGSNCIVESGLENMSFRKSLECDPRSPGSRNVHYYSKGWVVNIEMPMP
jgi:hypothetical protein